MERGSSVGAVPHYLIATDADWILDQVKAALGGPETMYPEYRKKLRDKYVRPEKCVSNANELAAGGCGGPGRLAPVIN